MFFGPSYDSRRVHGDLTLLSLHELRLGLISPDPLRFAEFATRQPPVYTAMLTTALADKRFVLHGPPTGTPGAPSLAAFCQTRCQ